MERSVKKFRKQGPHAFFWIWKARNRSDLKDDMLPIQRFKASFVSSFFFFFFF